jgi:hypothetical protein
LDTYKDLKRSEEKTGLLCASAMCHPTRERINALKNNSISATTTGSPEEEIHK